MYVSTSGQVKQRNHYPLEKTCVVCGSTFTVTNGDEFRNVACSKACGNKKAGETRRGEHHWNWGNPHEIRGERHQFFGRHQTQDAIEQNRLKHLGKPAWNQGQTGVYSAQTIEKMRISHQGMHISPATEFTKGFTTWNKGIKCPAFSGPNNANWKGGVTPELKKLRNSTAFSVWRGQVFERDDWTCQCCNKRGKYLHPHHINNFSGFPELRFSVKNGITLCRDCHAEFHRIYTRHNNNISQLVEFLRIDMEKLMRRLNDLFGGGFIEEYIQTGE